MIYDVANAVAINGDPVAGLETLWPRLGIVYLSDSPKGQWRHDPIGTGAVDFAAIGAFLCAGRASKVLSYSKFIGCSFARADRRRRSATSAGV